MSCRLDIRNTRFAHTSFIPSPWMTPGRSRPSSPVKNSNRRARRGKIGGRLVFEPGGTGSKTRREPILTKYGATRRLFNRAASSPKRLILRLPKSVCCGVDFRCRRGIHFPGGGNGMNRGRSPASLNRRFRLAGALGPLAARLKSRLVAPYFVKIGFRRVFEPVAQGAKTSLPPIFPRLARRFEFLTGLLGRFILGRAEKSVF